MKKNTLGFDKLRLNLTTSKSEEILYSTTFEDGICGRTLRGARFETRKIKNLTLKFYKNSIHIEGSFANFRNNTNTRLLTGDEVLDVADTLSRRLGIDLRWSTIRALEFALTDELAGIPNWYFEYFWPTSKFRIDRSQDNSLYLQTETRNKVLCLYNKSLQSERDGNLIRLELRLRGEIGKAIGHPRCSSLFLEDIATLETSQAMIETFRQTTQSFILRPLDTVEFTSINSVGDFKNYLVHDFLRDTEKREALAQLIEIKKSSKAIPSTNAQRISTLLRQIPGEASRQHIEELRSVIDTGCKNYLQNLELSSKIVNVPQTPVNRVGLSPRIFALLFIEALREGHPTDAKTFLADDLRHDPNWLLHCRNEIATSMGYKFEEAVAQGQHLLVSFQTIKVLSSGRTVSCTLNILLQAFTDTYQVCDFSVVKQRSSETKRNVWHKVKDIGDESLRPLMRLDKIVRRVCGYHANRESYQHLVAKGYEDQVRPCHSTYVGEISMVKAEDLKTTFRYNVHNEAFSRDYLEVTFFHDHGIDRILKMELTSFFWEDFPNAIDQMIASFSE